MDYWLKLIPYVLIVGGAFSWIFSKLEKRSQQKRRKLTTVTSRFGLFLSWIATAVALILFGFAVVVFYTWTTKDMWFLSGSLCVAALVVWLLGRGVFFVLAGSPPEEPQPLQAPRP